MHLFNPKYFFNREQSIHGFRKANHHAQLTAIIPDSEPIFKLTISMWQKKLLEIFENELFPLESNETLFNLYRDIRPGIDSPNAAEVRKDNLRKHLETLDFPRILVVGEAPGPRGCSSSGIPFTSEAQICNGTLGFVGKRSSLGKDPYNEYSAKIFWGIMRQHREEFLTWNCIPLQPHHPFDTFSIRTPLNTEILGFSDILNNIVNCLDPKTIIAVGRKAEFSLKYLNFSPIYVRHPSHGGKKLFEKGMKEIFNHS